MLFAISGSQGSGKTTVLNELQAQGFPIVERKTSRSIMDEWNVTLSEINNDRELTVKFQDEILTRKIEDEKNAAADVSCITFTERSYADLFTYALIAIGKDNQYNSWLNGYFDKCYKAQQTYTHNFYLLGGAFEVEHDGVRGSNLHYVHMVDIIMQDVIEKMHVFDSETYMPHGPSTTKILTPELQRRSQQILRRISQFYDK